MTAQISQFIDCQHGYLRKYGLEKIVRDLRVHRLLEGTNEMMRVVIGRAEAARIRASA